MSSLKEFISHWENMHKLKVQGVFQGGKMIFLSKIYEGNLLEPLSKIIDIPNSSGILYFKKTKKKN